MKNLNSFPDVQRKKRKPKSLLLLRTERYSFAFLSFAFTLISAWNGFHFYLTTFGLSLALLITATFEVARFSCLFKFIKKGRKKGILAVSLYLITAVVCAFTSINSFSTGVIKKNRTNNREVQKQILQVKESYAQKMAKEIDKISYDVRYLENMTIKYTGNGYWQRRLAKAITQKDKLIAERDRFLAIIPPDPQQWINMQATILGLKIGDLSEKNEDVAAVNEALKELWGFDQVKVQKLIGMGVTVTVELAILLLAMLATQDRRGKKRGKNGKANGLLEHYENEKDRETVENFFRTSLEAFVKTGKLPPLSKINKNLRPLGRYLRNLDPEFLRDLLQSQETEKSDP